MCFWPLGRQVHCSQGSVSVCLVITYVVSLWNSYKKKDVKISLMSFHFVCVMKGANSYYNEAFLVDSNFNG